MTKQQLSDIISKNVKESWSIQSYSPIRDQISYLTDNIWKEIKDKQLNCSACKKTLIDRDDFCNICGASQKLNYKIK